MKTCVDCGVEVSVWSTRCPTCSKKHELVQDHKYRERRRKRCGELSKEESISLVKGVIDKYLRENGPKRILYTHYIYDYGMEHNLYPSNWSYQKTMAMIAMTIPRCYPHKRDTPRSYSYTMVGDS